MIRAALPSPGVAESQLAGSGSGRIHALRRGEFLRRPKFHVDAGPAGSHFRFLSDPAERAVDVR